MSLKLAQLGRTIRALSHVLFSKWYRSSGTVFGIVHAVCGRIEDGTAHFWSVQPCSNLTVRMNGPYLILNWTAWMVLNGAVYAVPFKKKRYTWNGSLYGQIRCYNTLQSPEPYRVICRLIWKVILHSTSW